MLLASGCRASDVVSRCGGEEFSLLLPDTPSVQAALAGERLRRAIVEAPFEHAPITVSIGVAALFEQVDMLEALVGAADGALDEAKQAGKDRVIVAPVGPKLARALQVVWLDH